MKEYKITKLGSYTKIEFKDTEVLFKNLDMNDLQIKNGNKLVISNDCINITDTGELKIDNYTLEDLKQKISNYLYNTNPSFYTDMDYALLQWLTVQKN